MAFKELMTRGAQGVTGSFARTESGDGARTDSGAAAPRTILTQAPGPRTVAPSTSVDASSEFEGRLRCKETLRIDGRVIGEIECDKTVIIGQGARVHAGIEADEVQVSGIVEGDITARRKVTLDRTAVVVGDLTTPGIVIEEGAKLQGRILIGSDAGVAADAIAMAKAEKAEDAKSARPQAGPRETDAAVAASASGASNTANRDKDKDTKKSSASNKALPEASKSGQGAAASA